MKLIIKWLLLKPNYVSVFFAFNFSLAPKASIQCFFCFTLPASRASKASQAEAVG
jgi:hypothetical protein